MLFLIYINDLPKCLNFTTPCLYADDTQIFTSNKNFQTLVTHLNHDLNNISEWLIANKLQSHPSKMKSMIICPPHLRDKIGGTTPILMNNTVVKQVKCNKCLGVQIDEKLSWKEHTKYICDKASAGVGAIRRLKPFVPMTSLKSIYNALIQPYFDYCSPLWDNCSKMHKDKLQKYQSRAARIITGARYTISSKTILKQLDWGPLESRRQRNKATLMYKIIKEDTAPNLKYCFTKNTDIDKGYHLRNRETDLAIPAKPRTNYLKSTFRYSGVMLWNSLPREAKLAKSLSTFQKVISKLVET